MWTSLALLPLLSALVAAVPNIPPMGYYIPPEDSTAPQHHRRALSSGKTVSKTAWGATCTDFFFPVTVKKTSNYDLTMEDYNITVLHEIADRKVLKTNTYDISGRWCVPAKKHEQRRLKDTISVFVHGATFNKLMWDFPIADGKYSMIKAANEAGYTTFAFDLMGAGNSSVPDGYLEAQAASYVALTHEIVQGLRTTKQFGGKRWKRVIMTGFSIGGTISNALADIYPKDLDAIVLHGVSWGLKWVYPAFLAGLQASGSIVDPARWGNHHAFYQAHISPAARIAACFHGTYTEEMAALDYELRDLDTLGAAISFTYHLVTAPKYTGPVFLGIGEYDSTFCGALNCNISKVPWELPDRFPMSRATEVQVYEGSGHALIMHENGPDLIRDSLAFLKRNGF